MKKRLIILIILSLLLCLTACKENTPPPTDPTPPTVPKPTTKTVYVHTAVTQEFGSTVSRTEYLFNELDRVYEVVVYTNDDETNRYSVDCDENGNYIKWTCDGSVTEYAYDDQGHSLGLKVYISDELVSSTQYTWENGHRTSITTTIASQGLTQRAIMTYDNSGHLLRQDTYTADTLSSYSIYATDTQGRVTAMNVYQPDGTLFYTSTYARENNTETVTTTRPDDTIIQTTVITYDEHGNLLSQVVYDGNNNVISKETHSWKAVVVPLDCPRASV